MRYDLFVFGFIYLLRVHALRLSDFRLDCLRPATLSLTAEPAIRIFRGGTVANPQPNIWHAPMPLICSSFEPGHLDGAIEAMPDSDYRTIALA